jgi:hypothetical protein
MLKSKKKIEAEIPDRGGAIIDRRFWTVLLEPGEPKVLGGKRLPAGVLVMRNRGPGAVHVITGYTNVELILPPGATDLMIVRGHIGLAIIDGKPAVLEFEFLLALKQS